MNPTHVSKEDLAALEEAMERRVGILPPKDDRASQHTCHAKGCGKHCKPEWLMCYPHWRMVPKSIQNAIWANYQDGQCDGDPSPSERWHVAADAAIFAVAQKEGRLVDTLPRITSVEVWESIIAEPLGDSGDMMLGGAP